MARMNDILKKWADFSASETKPLFWMLLGPLLVMLTLIVAIPNFSNPYLPLITVMGFVLSWCYRVSGFSLTLIFFVFYFAFHYFFGHHDAFLWKMGWGCSLVLGLTIAFLSMEELKGYYAKEKGGKEKALKELQISLHSFEEKTATEKRVLENEIDKLKEELSSSREEIEVLLSLVDASQIESDKFYKQSETLSIDSIELQRELEALKVDLEQTREKFTNFVIKHQKVSKIAGQRLKELNALRVDLYQSRLLTKGYQKQIERARAYFKAKQKEQKATPIKETPIIPKENEGNLVLKMLEKDKVMIKKIYDQTLKDYQKLKTAFDEGNLKLQKAADEALSIEVNRLDVQVKEKKQKLEQTKSELIGIEREIFIIKKGLQEKGSFAH
ncbi:MAG: hypothetical protein P0S93_03385 [Candidatus Neptunochlamydia sp.]|nr:hypothetical protein [Candidatus Neptunochlamydia sp.]